MRTAAGLGRGLLGTVALAAASPALAQDAPEIGEQGSSLDLPGGGRPNPAGPGTLDGELAQPGGTTRDGPLRLPRSASDLELPGEGGPSRGVTVTGRSRPDYDPLGVRLGAFTLRSTATAAVGYDANVFRQSDGADDAFGRFRLDADLRSGFSRHAIDVGAFADTRAYANFGSENALAYGVNARGRLDVTRRDTLTADVRRERQVLDRGAVGEVLRTRRPVRYDLTSAGLSGRKLFGRFAADLSGQFSRYDYDDARDVAGAVVDQDFRDFDLYEGRLDLSYSSGAAASFFVSVGAEARRHRVTTAPIIRDLNVIEVLGGMRGEISPLIRGQLGLGYIAVDFKDPALGSRGGLGVNLSLDYLVTELTTVRLSGRRGVQNVGSARSPGSLTTQLAVGVDHELLRNLILSATAGYQHADFIGEDRTRNLYTLDFGARYLVNRRFRLGAEIDFARRAGSQEADATFDRDFSRLRASVSASFLL